MFCYITLLHYIVITLKPEAFFTRLSSINGIGSWKEGMRNRGYHGDYMGTTMGIHSLIPCFVPARRARHIAEPCSLSLKLGYIRTRCIMGSFASLRKFPGDLPYRSRFRCRYRRRYHSMCSIGLPKSASRHGAPLVQSALGIWYVLGMSGLPDQGTIPTALAWTAHININLDISRYRIYKCVYVYVHMYVCMYMCTHRHF